MDYQRRVVEGFRYRSQCEKLQAFKDALLWLAEKAGKLESKSKIIKEELAQVRKEFHEKIAELEAKL